MNHNHITSLTTCNNTLEANMIKHLLENEGIECFLTNETTSSLTYGFLGGLASGIQVMIDEKDGDEAIRVINQFRLQNKTRCPNCKSNNVVSKLGDKKFGKIILLILVLITMIPFVSTKAVYLCKDCGNEFKIVC